MMLNSESTQSSVLGSQLHENAAMAFLNAVRKVISRAVFCLGIVIGVCAISARFQPLLGQEISAEPAVPSCVSELDPDGTAERVSTHGMVMLLPNRPLHIQCRITHKGRSLESVRDDYLKELVTSLDVNMDGKVGFDETTKHPLFVSGRRFTNNEFLNSLRSKRSYTDQQLRLAVNRAAGQIVSIRENNSLIDSDLGVFNVLDRDGSGIIDRVEMRTAPSRIASRDQDFDKIISLGEFLDVPQENPADQLGMPVEAAIPTSVHSSLLRSALEPILAPRLIRKYDQDRDACLSLEELRWEESKFQALDEDHDQRLTVQELSRYAQTTPDLRLMIELESDGTLGPSMQLECASDLIEVDTSSPDILGVQCDDVTLSICYRQRDPFKEAQKSALDAFNFIDVDANGYLDRDEIVDHQRFERYLFDAMDADNDDRVFAEELKNFVHAHTEPAATSCQVNLLDLGNGYFQMLDANADGRISIRELRETENSLLNVSDSDAINPSLLPKTYRIEIERGGSRLFGSVVPVSNGAQPTDTLIRDPVGPMWFQRMDRNSDGDLTWSEFLGPREVFHRLDRDHDNLIDHQEAELANQLQTAK